MQGAASGEAAALGVQYASTQLQALVTIGASAFKGALAPGNDTTITPDELAQAIYRAVGRELQANSKRKLQGGRLRGAGLRRQHSC